ncbi:phosphoribosylanthranilate isomerase [Flavobacterium columnare]|uniref:N-(5'-phosphoribosyl)anthranilate isomerase n=1 Tax=Flavobacterium columnare TaxID=996 RepID=A0A437UDD5_9FLAO|nr:phosphoribosylanthranilate isomerase [Flavobacterium columnare]
MKIKICGMKDSENIQEIASLNPDYLGFIFYEKSERNIQIKTLPIIPETIQKVGVFVNTPLEAIINKIHQYNLNVLQLHGNESIEFCKTLKKDLQKISRKITIIKVFSIGETFDFNLLLPYEKICDYFLFDTKGKQHGGNGIVFNWQLLENYPSEKHFFLSGGIGIDEIDLVQEFLKTNIGKKCYAIDVNSKFENNTGLKDVTRCKQLINKLR